MYTNLKISAINYDCWQISHKIYQKMTQFHCLKPSISLMNNTGVTLNTVQEHSLPTTSIAYNVCQENNAVCMRDIFCVYSGKFWNHEYGLLSSFSALLRWGFNLQTDNALYVSVGAGMIVSVYCSLLPCWVKIIGENCQ